MGHPVNILKQLIYFLLGLSEEMASAGYKDVTSIDIVPGLIDYLSQKYKDVPQLSCKTKL